MRSIRVLLLLAAAFLTQSVMAQPPDVSGIGAALGELTARVEALEASSHSAPDSSVVGRTYCHVVGSLRMFGEDPLATERLLTFVIRRTTTFLPNLMFSGDLESAVLRIQNDDGRVVQFPFFPVSPVLGSYTQVGNRLDITFFFDTDLFATWYVSKDGSVIHGTLINDLPSVLDNETGVTTTSGFTSHWVLTEKGDNECLGELD